MFQSLDTKYFLFTLDIDYIINVLSAGLAFFTSCIPPYALLLRTADITIY